MPHLNTPIINPVSAYPSEWNGLDSSERPSPAIPRFPDPSDEGFDGFAIDLSVVIPAFEEAESLPELIPWIARVCETNGLSYEVIIVDDGSRKDATWPVIKHLAHENERVRGIKFRRNYGKSACLNVAFEAAQGRVIVTMDADLQDSPDELPWLYARLLSQDLDLISGWKKKRYDPLSKTLPTKLFNQATRRMSGIYNLHDFNCGLKAYRHEVVKSIEVYGEMHRYIPVLAKWAGFPRIEEQVVQHRPRKYGKSKFGLNRFINGFLDLLSIYFTQRFGKKPMHFFGALGLFLFMIGTLIVMFLVGEKLYTNWVLNKLGRAVTDQWQFYVSLTLAIVGSQLFLAGFLGELISRNSTERNVYLIGERV